MLHRHHRQREGVRQLLYQGPGVQSLLRRRCRCYRGILKLQEAGQPALLYRLLARQMRGCRSMRRRIWRVVGEERVRQ